MMYKYIIFIAILCLNLSLEGRSAEPTRQDLVNELILEFNIKNSTDFDVEKIVEHIIKNDPQYKPYKDVFIAFFTKYLTWEGVKPMYDEIFLKEFSSSDLIKINTFLITPAFKSWLASSGDVETLSDQEREVVLDFTTSDIGIHFFKVIQELSNTSNEFVGRVVIQHKKELDAMMDAKTQELVK